MFLDSLHPAELELIVRLQKFDDFALVMKVLSDFGPSTPLLIFLGLLYLCFDARLGARVLFVYFASDLFSYFLKLAFHLPRPFWMDARIIAFEPSATSYGFPSGHAIVATCVWFLLASTVRRWWAWVGATLIALLVSLSRVYRGAHFISDVVAGLAIGATFLILYLAVERKIQPRAKGLRFTQQIATCILGVTVLTAIGIAIFLAAGQVDDPTRWPNHPGTRHSVRTLGLYSGAILGLGIGLNMTERWARFDAGGSIRMRFFRVILLAGPAALYWLRPEGLLKDLNEPLKFTLSFIGCTLAAWACIFLLPWLFLKFGLMEERRLQSPS